MRRIAWLTTFAASLGIALVTAETYGSATTDAWASRPSAKALALSARNFPAGAKQNVISDLSGRSGQLYNASFNFRAQGAEEEVTDLVATAPTAAQAEGNYVSYLEENSGFQGEKTLRLPAYGRRQAANWAAYTNSDGAKRARAVVVVLKGTVVWVVTVENCGVLAPFGCAFGPTPPEIAQSKATSELEKYALAEERLVGRA